MSHAAASDAEMFRAALIDSAAARAGEHPDAETLVDYLTRDLAAEVEKRISDHLVSCRQCASTVLDLEPLTRPDGAARDGVADFEKEAAWRDLRAKIFTREPPARVFMPQRWSTAVAASLLLATLGLSGWVARLQHSTTELRGQLAELSRPQVNLPVFYVGDVKRSSDEETLEVPAAASRFALFFSPSGLEEYPEYQVVFIDAEGREAHRVDGLVLSESAGLRLGLPRGILPQGEYLLRLSGRDGDQWKLLEEHRRRIVYLEAP